jgi:hypothetical protein
VIAALLVAAAAMLAQQPKLVDARLATRALRGSLAQEVAGATETAFWLAWTAPAVPGNRQSCWPSENRILENKAQLEGPRDVHILLRIEHHWVQRVRTFTPDCEIDAGGFPVVWLTGVSAAESVRYLRSIAFDATSAVDAIGLQRGPEADAALEEMAGSTQPDKIRRKAAFWLGATRGSRGVALLTKMVREEREDGFREHLTFALSQSKEGVTVLIDLARSTKPADRKVRDKAIFWLAKSRDPEARRFIEGILNR